MKETYEKIEIELQSISDEDIITTSEPKEHDNDFNDISDFFTLE